MSERLGGYEAEEAPINPEIEAMLEFLGVYGEIQEIMAWLVEASVEADTAVVAAKRAKMHALIGELGLDPESADAFSQLEGIRTDLANRTANPQPRIEIPEVAYFREEVELIITSYLEGYNETPFFPPAEGETSLIDIARHGHTDWTTVNSRTARQDIGEYIHGVATIMADPVAYSGEFAGIGVDSMHRHPDKLTINMDWSIDNGRHRGLAAKSLGEDFIAEAGMAQWISVAVESDQ